MIAICNPNLEAAFSRFGLVMNVLVFGSWHHQSFWHITLINRGDDQNGCEIADCWVSLKIGSPKKSIVHHFPQQQLGYTQFSVAPICIFDGSAWPINSHYIPASCANFCCLTQWNPPPLCWTLHVSKAAFADKFRARWTTCCWLLKLSCEAG